MAATQKRMIHCVFLLFLVCNALGQLLSGQGAIELLNKHGKSEKIQSVNVFLCYTDPRTNVTYVLFGQERKDGSWNGLAGGVDENEMLFETAIREVEEESGGRIILKKDFHLSSPDMLVFVRTKMVDKQKKEKKKNKGDTTKKVIILLPITEYVPTSELQKFVDAEVLREPDNKKNPRIDKKAFVWLPMCDLLLRFIAAQSGTGLISIKDKEGVNRSLQFTSNSGDSMKDPEFQNGMRSIVSGENCQVPN